MFGDNGIGFLSYLMSIVFQLCYGNGFGGETVECFNQTIRDDYEL